MNNTSLKTKKIIAILLFALYIGSISLLAQNKPNSYVAQKTTEEIQVDGKMDELSWEKAKWSEIFKDIEGEKSATYNTRFKMIWDQHYLYFLAEIKEPHVWATLKKKDTIIFYNNDFEIFIDPDGDTHNYYEYEMNALNTIWDLFLSKPYRNGGYILGDWDFKGLKSAVHVNGTLNDSRDIDEGWTAEIAIPWSFVTPPGGTTDVPENKFWRVNFSRVNWEHELNGGRYTRKKDASGKYLHESNWVWSPQGVINMHEPEHWGYVYFSTDKVGVESHFTIPEDEHIKWYLYELYRDYGDENKGKVVWRKNGKAYTTAAKMILGKSVTPILEKNTFGFDIWATSPFTNKKLIVHDDGKFESFQAE